MRCQTSGVLILEQVAQLDADIEGLRREIDAIVEPQGSTNREREVQDEIQGVNFEMENFKQEVR
jgi:hypothetical protein